MAPEKSGYYPADRGPPAVPSAHVRESEEKVLEEQHFINAGHLFYGSGDCTIKGRFLTLSEMVIFIFQCVFGAFP